jgi:hypothetical protein
MDGSAARHYLVERYLPGVAAEERLQMSRRLARAADALTGAGAPIRYLGSTFVPAEESCFSRFESASERAVRRVLDAAEVPYARILAVESI